MNIKIKKMNENAQIPTSGSSQAAGYDLYICADTDMIVVRPHQTVMVGTGISIAIPDGYFGAVYPRSGIASKRGLRPANCVGVIDSDYRGEIKVALHNDSDGERVVANHERVAQLIIQPYQTIVFEETDELDETERGAGGFGHSGV